MKRGFNLLLLALNLILIGKNNASHFLSGTISAYPAIEYNTTVLMSFSYTFGIKNSINDKYN